MRRKKRSGGTKLQKSQIRSRRKRGQQPPSHPGLALSIPNPFLCHRPPPRPGRRGGAPLHHHSSTPPRLHHKAAAPSPASRPAPLHRRLGGNDYDLSTSPAACCCSCRSSPSAATTAVHVLLLFNTSVLLCFLNNLKLSS